MKINHMYLVSLLLILLFPLYSAGQRYSSPQKTFEIYKEAAKVGNVNVYLESITSGSRQMLQGQLPTKDILIQEYNYLKDKKYGVTKRAEKTAILYFKKNTEYELPYLFSRENNEWKIDLKAMQEKIYFDANKKWYIVGENFAIPKEEK